MSFEKFLTNMVLQIRAERKNELNSSFHVPENDEYSLSNKDDNLSSDNVIKELVPYGHIYYENQNYIVIPYRYKDCCLCVTGNTIVALVLEEESFVLDTSQKAIVIKAELRDPFKHRIMNRKDRFVDLEKTEQCFYYEIFKEARKLNMFFSNHKQWSDIRDAMLTLIEEGLLGKRMSLNIINNKLQELSGKQYICDNEKILCNGIESSLYLCCIDIYEYQ